MSRITATNFAQFRLSYTPFEAWAAGSMTLQLARAELRYRVTACNAPLATGDLPPSSASPSLEYAYSGFVDLPLVNPSSHLSFAFWLSGPVTSDRTVTRASISVLSSSSDTVRTQILSVSQNQPLSFDAATYASVLLQDVPLYMRSNNSLRLFIDVASRGESSTASKRWNLRMVAATRNCYIRSFALTQWGRESPSACGGVSCFTDVNAMPALQFVDDYNYALGGTAYTTGGYQPSSASGPLMQPAIGDVNFDDRHAHPMQHIVPCTLFSPPLSRLLQRWPHVYRSKNRECAPACIARRHHGCCAGHRRRHAVLSTAACERVSGLAVKPAPHHFVYVSYRSRFNKFSATHACRDAAAAGTVTLCARFHPPSAVMASSSPACSPRSAASAAARATKGSAPTSWPPAPCPPSAPTSPLWSAQPLPPLYCAACLASSAVQVADVVVDGTFFAGGGGSSAWSGNRSLTFTLAAPTSLLFAVTSPLRSCSCRSQCFVNLPCSGERGVSCGVSISLTSANSLKSCYNKDQTRACMREPSAP